MTDFNVDSALSGDAVLASDLTGAVPILAAMSGDAAMVGSLVEDFTAGSVLSGKAYLGAAFYQVQPVPIESTYGSDGACGGFLVRYADNVPGPFRAETSWGTQRFFQPISLGTYAILSMGTHRLKEMPFDKGTIVAQVITGASGGLVTSLRDDYSGFRIAIQLDGSNRPYFTVQDLGGTIVAQANVWGAAIAANTHLTIKATWNANTGDVSFSVNGQDTPAWATYPSGPWFAVVLASAVVGPGGFLIDQIQVSRLLV